MNLENVGHKIWGSVWNSMRKFVGISVRVSAWKSVRYSMGISVGDSVWDSVKGSVGVSVLNSVYGIQDAIREERFNNEAAQKNIFF
jgi:hypothetical protein